MFLYFKNTKTLYTKLWGIYFLAFLLFYMLHTYVFSFIISFLLTIVIEIVLWISIVSMNQKTTNHQMQEICDVLCIKMDVDGYLQAILTMKTMQVKNRNQRILLAYYEAIGVAMQGNYKQALMDLEKLPLDVAIKQNARVLYLFMARLSLVQGDTDKAQQYYQNCVQLKGNATLQNVQVWLFVSEVEMAINYAQGSLDEAAYIAFLTSFLATKKLSLLYQVIVQSILLRLYQKTEQRECAITTAMFICNQGGSLLLAHEAKSFLGKEGML